MTASSRRDGSADRSTLRERGRGARIARVTQRTDGRPGHVAFRRRDERLQDRHGVGRIEAAQDIDGREADLRRGIVVQQASYRGGDRRVPQAADRAQGIVPDPRLGVVERFQERLRRVSGVHARERRRRGRTHRRRVECQRVSQRGNGPGVLEQGEVLHGRAPHGLAAVASAGDDSIGAAGVAEVARDSHRRFPNHRVGILEQPGDAFRHLRVTDRVQRRDDGLPYGRIGVTEQAHQRVVRLGVAETRERARGGQRKLGVAQGSHQGQGRFPIANAAQRDDRRLTGLEILRVELARSADPRRRRRSGRAPRPPGRGQIPGRAAASARAGPPGR